MKDLQNAIMNRVLTARQDKKTWKRKEKTIQFIYVGAIFLVLSFLFFVKSPWAVSPKFRLPDLTKFEPGSQDLMIYFKMFAVMLVFSVIAFGVFFVKSRRSHNRVDKFFPGKG
ncbi:MAG: hypothetical protein HC867_04920 [Bacteroidia bacterium]|nr:hypothetical protein [Bacteroidia bacterium]